MVNICYNLDPPGSPTLTLSQVVWIENHTYTATCTSSQGNPENIYTWSLDNVNNVHTGDTYNITARKGQRIIRCTASNRFTMDRGTELSSSKNINVHCKFII